MDLSSSERFEQDYFLIKELMIFLMQVDCSPIFRRESSPNTTQVKSETNNNLQIITNILFRQF